MTPIVIDKVREERVINFGKYKGYKVTFLIGTSPSYILWAKKNVKGFQLTEEEERLLMKYLSRRIRFDMPCICCSNEDDDDATISYDNRDFDLEDDLMACFDPNY